MNEVVLETKRLILRQPRRADLEPLAALLADPEVMRHMGGPQPYANAWRTLATTAGSWSIEGFSFFTVVEKAPAGGWVGMIGPWRPPEWPGPEVGWMIARPFWGKGYAAEAAACAIDWAFETLGWEEVVHIINAGNKASETLARRLGAQRRGAVSSPMAPPQAPGMLPPLVPVWKQTRAEWRARRKDRGLHAAGDGTPAAEAS